MKVSTEASGLKPVTGRWGAVIAAWLLVSIPLLWGVWQTIKKAAALFR
jgi:hypothetical protein